MTAPDVVVVGGGPVGLAAAIAARIRSSEVLVADRAHPPIDKPCGEGLMSNGVAALRRLGISLDYPNATRFRGIRFAEDGRSALRILSDHPCLFSVMLALHSGSPWPVAVPPGDLTGGLR